MEYPSFEKFAEVVRDYASVKRGTLLYPKMQLERDLGINEVRCSVLLKALETHYGVTLTSESFDLQPHERLFRSEGADKDSYIQTILRNTSTEVRPLTLGQLCHAVLKELSKQ